MNTWDMFTMIRGLTVLLTGTSTFVYGFLNGMCGGGYGNSYPQGDMVSLMSSAQSCQYSPSPSYFYPSSEGAQSPMSQQPMNGGSCQIGGSCSSNGYGSQPGGGQPMQQSAIEECDVMTVVDCSKPKGNTSRSGNYGWNQPSAPKYSQQQMMQQSYGSPHSYGCDCGPQQQNFNQQGSNGGNGGMQNCDCQRQAYNYPGGMTSSMLTGQTTSMCNNTQGTTSGFSSYMVTPGMPLGSNLTECSSAKTTSTPVAVFGTTELPYAPGLSINTSSCTPNGAGPCGMAPVN